MWGLGKPSPTPNFVKIDEGDIPLWGKYLPKITNFTWDFLSQAKFCTNFLRGYTPLGQIYIKDCRLQRFCRL